STCWACNLSLAGCSHKRKTSRAIITQSSCQIHYGGGGSRQIRQSWGEEVCSTTSRTSLFASCPPRFSSPLLQLSTPVIPLGNPQRSSNRLALLRANSQ